MFGVGVGVGVGRQHFGSGVAPYVGLLDDYPGASAAYSLRLLRSGYTENAIRVRRTDLSEQNIGFDANGNLDTTALLAFTGTGVLDNGFVTTWYDQSGNGFNQTQTTALNQPQIVSAGAVLLQGSKPTLRFDGVNDFMDGSGVTTGNPKSIFMATKAISLPNSEVVIFDSVTTNQALLYKAQNNVISIGFGTFTGTSYTATTNFILYSILQNSTTSNAYINSSTQILTNQNLGTNAFNGLRIASVRGIASLFYNGNMPEFVVWGSNQASNRLAIESNINSYYAIY
jgi:hypothetical protein